MQSLQNYLLFDKLAPRLFLYWFRKNNQMLNGWAWPNFLKMVDHQTKSSTSARKILDNCTQTLNLRNWRIFINICCLIYSSKFFPINIRPVNCIICKAVNIGSFRPFLLLYWSTISRILVRMFYKSKIRIIQLFWICF